MGEEGTYIDCDRFCRWAKQNCPRVFDGIHFWMIKMLLYRGHSPGTVPQVLKLAESYLRLFTVLYFPVRLSIRVAILHECQNYLGGRGTAIIPDVRPLGPFEIKMANMARYISMISRKNRDCEQSKSYLGSPNRWLQVSKTKLKAAINEMQFKEYEQWVSN